MQQGFGCADREVVPILSGISPGNVDGGERGVEREGKSLFVPGLAVSEPRELLGIAEDELQLEPRPDVRGVELVKKMSKLLNLLSH